MLIFDKFKRSKLLNAYLEEFFKPTLKYKGSLTRKKKDFFFQEKLQVHDHYLLYFHSLTKFSLNYKKNLKRETKKVLASNFLTYIFPTNYTKTR